MKKTALFIFIYAVAVSVLLAVRFPHTMRMLEGDNLFLLNASFIQSLLGSIVFGNEWLSAFLMQFFRVPLLGGVVMSVLFICMGMTALWMSSALRKSYNAVWALLPLVVQSVWFPFNISLVIEAAFLFFLLGLVLRIKQSWIRALCGAFGLVLLMPFVSFSLLLLMAVVLVLFEVFVFKKKYHAVAYVASLVCICVFIQLWSEHVAFIPFDQRYLYVYTLSGFPMALLWISTLAATLAIIFFLPEKSTKYSWHNILLFILFVATTLICNLSDEKLNYNEKCYRYVHLADEQRWQQLLSDIQEDGIGDDVIKTRFCLMAESALGTLPDNLFHYNIVTPDDFHFRYDRSVFACLFNQLFYQSCGIYDEAMHHASEYANQKNKGFCFSSLRHMADYAIRTQDFPVARKYLAILAKSTLHDDFVQSRYEELRKQSSASVHDTVALRRDNFVGCYPFNSEMVRLAEQFPHNPQYLDYLLCGLLLQKDLQKFRIILEGFPRYHDKPLPKAYAEANALLLAQTGVQDSMFQMPDDITPRFSAFLSAYKANDSSVSANYSDTYWYYYFYTQNRQEEKAHVTYGH